MLSSLTIRNMLLIDHLDVDFQNGLNILTGETGAGKSILLDCLGFVLGRKTRSDLIAAGAEAGEVGAIFVIAPDHPSVQVLEDAELPVSDELILRRVVRADGRKQAFVNDRRCSTDALRALSDTLVEIHGQHDDRGLLNEKRHRAYLDTYGVPPAVTDNVQAAWRSLTDCRTRLRAAEAEAEDARRDEEFIRHALQELDALAPEAGEADTLDAKRRLMQAAGRIRDDIAKAAEAISATGAEGQMADARRWLEGVADKAEGRLAQPLDSLERAQTELGEALAAVEAVLRELDVNPLDLEAVEERLFAIRGLARKHSVNADDLQSFRLGLAEQLAAIEGSDTEIAGLVAAEQRAGEHYEEAADGLSLARKAASTALDAAIAAELAPLKMEHATFATSLVACAEGPSGRENVVFEAQTNPGTAAGPISKIASGGELSRFLLALKVCLTSRADGLAMIFDEIDRGVGGATADAVGRRLGKLAEKSQILVVTHSPQVAARGVHHLRVEKVVAKGRTRSVVRPLNASQREGEIARMLSGSKITDAAQAAALSLLQTD